MTLRTLLLMGLIICAISQACALTENRSAVVNVIVASELYPDASNGSNPVNETIMLLNELDSRNLNVSIFITGDMSNANPLYATLIGSKANHEMAIAGKTTGEDLSELSASDLNVRLLRAKADTESNYICGSATMKIRGFIPQPGSFKPGSIPYEALEDVGIRYMVDDSGYSGLDSVWPEQPLNQSIYIIPVSAQMVSGRSIYITDLSASQQGLNGTEWYDVLEKKFNETSASGEPLVVVFRNTVSGSGEYLDAYSSFINYTASRDAEFVTSAELLEMEKR